MIRESGKRGEFRFIKTKGKSWLEKHLTIDLGIPELLLVQLNLLMSTMQDGLMIVK